MGLTIKLHSHRLFQSRNSYFYLLIWFLPMATPYGFLRFSSFLHIHIQSDLLRLDSSWCLCGRCSERNRREIGNSSSLVNTGDGKNGIWACNYIAFLICPLQYNAWDYNMMESWFFKNVYDAKKKYHWVECTGSFIIFGQSLEYSPMTYRDMI